MRVGQEKLTFSANKSTVSQKRCKIGPKLLLMTNRKSHTPFRLVPKSTTLHDLEKNVYFGAHHKNLNENRPILSAAEMQANDSTFWQYKIYAGIRRGSREKTSNAVGSRVMRASIACMLKCYSYSYSYRVTLFNELFSEESCSVIGLSEKMGFQL